MAHIANVEEKALQVGKLCRRKAKKPGRKVEDCASNGLVGVESI